MQRHPPHGMARTWTRQGTPSDHGTSEHRLPRTIRCGERSEAVPSQQRARLPGSTSAKTMLRQPCDAASGERCRYGCHNCQISEAISAYRPSGPAFPASNHRTNSSCTTQSTSLADLQARSRGKMVPASGSYSSVFSFSNAIPIGSCRKRSADTESNKSPYSALSWRRSFRISSRVLGMCFHESIRATRKWTTLSFSEKLDLTNYDKNAHHRSQGSERCYYQNN